MAETSPERTIYLDDILGEDGVANIAHKDGWPSVGLRFKPGTDEAGHITRLEEAAKASNGTFAMYTADTMPARWRFSSAYSPRVAPVYIIPELGWSITDHDEVEHGDENVYRPKGNHGYDNVYPEMRAIFLASGPSFKRIKEVQALAARAKAVYPDDQSGSGSGQGWVSVKPYVMKAFNNLEIYSLILRLMGLSKFQFEPAHNGTPGFWDQYFPE